MCTGLVQACSNEVTSFYFKPKSKRFAFDKQPLGIKTLNNILPSSYKEGSLKRKTAVHTVYVVEEGLIRDRTGHGSNVLFIYEKIPWLKKIS